MVGNDGQLCAAPGCAEFSVAGLCGAELCCANPGVRPAAIVKTTIRPASCTRIANSHLQLFVLSMIFSDLPSPAEAPNETTNRGWASRRRETGYHFSGSCSKP